MATGALRRRLRRRSSDENADRRRLRGLDDRERQRSWERLREAVTKAGRA